VAVVQYTFTHKQHIEYREWNIHNNKRKKIGKCRPCPVFASYTLAFALQLKKKHGNTSVRVVEECPYIPVIVVQYTFTHKQYTEQHNETEYTERNIYLLLGFATGILPPIYLPITFWVYEHHPSLLCGQPTAFCLDICM
jgi:hypothetical protein